MGLSEQKDAIAREAAGAILALVRAEMRPTTPGDQQEDAYRRLVEALRKMQHP